MLLNESHVTIIIIGITLVFRPCAVQSIATMLKWIISRVGVKSAFLQTGRAELDAYVRPSSERNHKNIYL